MLCIFLNPRPVPFYVLNWSFRKSTIKKQNDVLECSELVAWCESGSPLCCYCVVLHYYLFSTFVCLGLTALKSLGVLHPDLQMAPCDSIFTSSQIRLPSSQAKYNSSPHWLGCGTGCRTVHTRSPLVRRCPGSLLTIRFLLSQRLNVPSSCK